MQDKYDVIIIGGGISGLICGCYLAKDGKKVLIVEQNGFPGGCCSSFEREGFHFDIGVHSLGSCRKNGQLGRVIHELGLNKTINLKKFDPSETIATRRYHINIYSDINRTINELQNAFPKEKNNIQNFFNFINNENLINETLHKKIEIFAKFKNKSFKDVLDLYFYDRRIKSLLSILLGNIGLPSKKTAAIAGFILFKEFILDGGYYPLGGMQAFSNALAKKFSEFGGTIHYFEKAKKILIQNNKIQGISTNRDQYFSKNVVSAIDAREVYFNLMNKEWTRKELLKNINNLEPSISLFITYLGINKKIEMGKGINGSNIWYFPEQDFDIILSRIINKKDLYFNSGVFCTIPTRRDCNLAPENSDIISLIVGANYANGKIWNKIKYKVADEIINRVEGLIPNISKKIIIKEVTTPLTLYNYTSNFNGAMHGWASTVTQTNNFIIKPITHIKHLYITGHWLTQLAPGGTPMAAFSGVNTAKLILANNR